MNPIYDLKDPVTAKNIVKNTIYIDPNKFVEKKKSIHGTDIDKSCFVYQKNLPSQHFENVITTNITCESLKCDSLDSQLSSLNQELKDLNLLVTRVNSTTIDCVNRLHNLTLESFYKDLCNRFDKAEKNINDLYSQNLKLEMEINNLKKNINNGCKTMTDD